MADSTTVYRLFDRDDGLLYIGMAGNPGRRFEQHAGDKPWWADVARAELEHHPTRQAAMEAERAAIVAERPLHNKTHNGPHRPPPREREIQMMTAPSSNGLVGRYIHAGSDRGWQGVIVAEPASEVYLVELFSWVTGSPTHQTIVPLEQMMIEGWRFYDDAEWMNNAYEYGGVAEMWEAERARDGAPFNPDPDAVKRRVDGLEQHTFSAEDLIRLGP